MENALRNNTYKGEREKQTWAGGIIELSYSHNRALSKFNGEFWNLDGLPNWGKGAQTFISTIIRCGMLSKRRLNLECSNSLWLRAIIKESLAAGGMSAFFWKGKSRHLPQQLLFIWGNIENSDARKIGFEMFYYSLRAHSSLSTLAFSLQPKWTLTFLSIISFHCCWNHYYYYYLIDPMQRLGHMWPALFLG